MKVLPSLNGHFDLIAEQPEDEALIDALYLEHHVHMVRPILAGSRVAGATLCVDASSSRALRDQAAREALRALGQLIGIGLRESTGHGHVDSFAMNPQLQEQFAPSLEQLKLMADALTLVVGQLQDQGRIGTHGNPSGELPMVAQGGAA